MNRWSRLSLSVALLLMPALPGALAAECQLQRYPAFAVTMKDLRPMVDVQVNGTTARFIVDTGAFWSMLSPAARAQYDLPEGMAPPGFYVRGANGDTDADIATVRTLTFLHFSLHGVQFIVGGNDYSSGAAGLLGDNLWRVADVEYDFANGVMRFDKATHCGDQRLAYWAGRQPVGMVKLRYITALHPHLIGHARIDGKRIRVMFDTGFPRSMLTLEAAKRLGITPDSPGVKPAGDFGGIAREWRKAWIAPVALFEIGGEKIEHTHLLVGDIRGIGDVDMYLGSDFFLSHHLYVANSQHRLYLTYNGGPIFALGQRYLIQRAGAKAVLAGPGVPSAAQAGATGASPASPNPAGGVAGAGELARQGMALDSEDQYVAALADLTRACRLDPKNAEYRYHRGRIHEAIKQPAEALADFNSAITLDPGLFRARLARAALLLSWKEAPADAAGEARTDINIVALEVPDESQLRLQLAGLYDRIGQYDAAIRQVDQWIYYHRRDALLPVALNTRCWIRAEANIDLGQALKDCDRALAWQPKSADILDSRGLVYLRLGELDRAIADYDAALAIKPKIATSLYGRGLAEQREGKKTQGQADLAAAAKIEPGVERRFSSMKLAPGCGAPGSKGCTGPAPSVKGCNAAVRGRRFEVFGVFQPGGFGTSCPTVAAVTYAPTPPPIRAPVASFRQCAALRFQMKLRAKSRNRRASCASSTTWLFSRNSTFGAYTARRDPQVSDL